MAGKTGLNISHAEPLPQFIERYDHAEWLKPWVEKWDAVWIQNWMKGLGIDSYVGSSGRIFPVEMKAAPLLRAWLKRLAEQQVKFFYRHRCINLHGTTVTFENKINRILKPLPNNTMRLCWLVGLYLGLNWAVMVLGNNGWINLVLNLFKQVMQGYCILGQLLWKAVLVSL